MRTNTTKVNFSKYKGKEVAIIKGRVVASGNSSRVVFETARKVFPKIAVKDIILLSVPKEKITIYVVRR
ncbi:MAG: DUF5678 domain-containing protein [Candidatus Pacebacteria bacterium]|nr:DUF5678 domain-containing protein [Candidatus Paceibacterota bacterium]